MNYAANWLPIIRGDNLDRVRKIEDREFALRSIERESRLLQRVEGALREIEEGTFGICAACDHDIPVRRLEAVPLVTLLRLLPGSLRGTLQPLPAVSDGRTVRTRRLSIAARIDLRASIPPLEPRTDLPHEQRQRVVISGITHAVLRFRRPQLFRQFQHRFRLLVRGHATRLLPP